jgi:hypothetical protein
VDLKSLLFLKFVERSNRSGGQPEAGQQNLELPKLPNPYRTVSDIVTMPAGRTMGSTNAINVDAKGNIWVFERCGVNSCADSSVDPILQFDPPRQADPQFRRGKVRVPARARVRRRGQPVDRRRRSDRQRQRQSGLQVLAAEWRQFVRPSGVRIQNDILYVADSESRTAPGQYGDNPGYHRGIYIGSVTDGVVTAFIPDPAPKRGASFPEGISLGSDGVIWALRSAIATS